MRRTARGLTVAALAGLVVCTAPAVSAAPAASAVQGPVRTAGTPVTSSVPCSAATGGAVPDLLATPDTLAGTRIKAGVPVADARASDPDCTGGTGMPERPPGPSLGVPGEGAGRRGDTGAATGRDGTADRGEAGLPDTGIPEPRIPDPQRTGTRDTGTPYRDPYDTGTQDGTGGLTPDGHGTHAPGTGRPEDGRQDGTQDGRLEGTQEGSTHDGRACDEPYDAACDTADVPRGANAGTGGAFNDSVPALVVGSLLIAGAFGAAAHRLWRRRPDLDS
jgi:hypothetical protein